MIAVIDYGIGNLRSAEKALLHVGGDARLIDNPADLRDVDGVVLPGVGSFGACAQAVRSVGFEEPLRELITARVPFLGLCVGFQLLFHGSEESPTTPGLGILTGVVRRLSGEVKLPQMQWNSVEEPSGRRAAMLAGLPNRPWFYFVHSFAPFERDLDPDGVALTCDYGDRFVAAIERDTVWGTQFHPEKSGRLGLSLLANFVSRCTRQEQSEQAMTKNVSHVE